VATLLDHQPHGQCTVATWWLMNYTDQEKSDPQDDYYNQDKYDKNNC